MNSGADLCGLISVCTTNNQLLVRQLNVTEFVASRSHQNVILSLNCTPETIDNPASKVMFPGRAQLIRWLSD